MKRPYVSDIYARRLYEARGIGKRTIFRLRAAMNNSPDFAKRLFQMNDMEIMITAKEAGAESKYENIVKAVRSRPGREWVLNPALLDAVNFITIDDPSFPKGLRNIPDPPFALYYAGTLPEEGRPKAAVIGSRTPTEYGKTITEIFSKNLAANGVQIISGMAYGVDSTAEAAALSASEYAVAVLGCGIDICYPEKNYDLYSELIQRGCVMSEYPLGTKPMHNLFPERNRIISGISDLVLVIEAKEKSGTLITVDMALEQGREVYAVPGRINDKTSVGCNRLIRQGAGIACTPGDILEALGIDCGDSGDVLNKRIDISGLNLSQLHKSILANLDRSDPKELEQILEKLSASFPSLTYAELRTEMTMLMLKQLVKESAPGHFLLAY